MKRIIVFCIVLLLLAGCGGKESTAPQVQLDARVEATATPAPTSVPVTAAPVTLTAVPEVITAAPAVTAEPAPTEAPTPEPAAAGPVEALVARWEAEGLLSGLYPMEAMDALDLYGIDFDACRGGAAFGDADGYTNEAVLVQGDPAVLDQVEALLKDHLEDVKAQFRSYDAKALALAEKAVLVREGDAVLYIISPNAADMLAAFRSLTA